ncbi:MAG: S41 family peptidase [Chloroflexota bacterium]
MKLVIARTLFSILILTGMLLAACGPSAPGSPRGDRAAGTPGGSGAVNPTRDPANARTLEATEIGLVYALLFQEYVDPVDGATLVNGAGNSVSNLLRRSGFLPIDSAVMDLLPVTGDAQPARIWAGFSNSYEALVEKHVAWARQARPDHAAIRGMLASLNDTHTTFIDPDDRRRMAENTYVGIGVRLSKPEDARAPIIVEVFPRSPAAQAGLRAGDRIESADQTVTTELPLTEIVRYIRGAPDSRVKIGYSRQGQSRSVDVTRAAVEPRRVDGGPLGSGVGYIRIRSFATDVPNAVFDQLTTLERARSTGIRGLVLDLRGNTGGELRAVANVGGAFFPGQTLGLSVDRTGTQTPLQAEGRKRVTDDPIIVLIDRDTGSGAEILASALREHGLATIVGTNSAGSVGIAQVHDLPDGSAVQITERRLLTPSGARLDRVGVKPDIEVRTEVTDLENAKDPPLERAIQLVKDRITG